MLILSLAQGAFCAYVLVLVVMVLNAMSHRTLAAFRFSYLLLGIGSVDGLYHSMTAPSLQMVCMSAGMAIFLAYNGRRCDASKS